MAKTTQITLQLSDGSSRSFVGDGFRINEPVVGGLMEVVDTETNEVVWKEGIVGGVRDIVQVQVTKVESEGGA